MKTEMKLSVRAYPVKIRDERTGEISADLIVLEKARLQAGGMVGLSDEDIIRRIYNRKGLWVLEIGKAHKHEITLDLHDLYQQAVPVREVER